jgi:endonuclease/exonuclease/phosphatase (EEP) superfamily protein YafD
VGFLGALALCLVLRSWRWAGAAILGLVLNAVELVPHAFPVPSAVAVDPAPLSATPALQVATINLLKSNRDHAALLALVRSRDSDVIFFQEVTPAWAAVLTRLRDVYPHQFRQPPATGSFGMAVLSRVPWESAGLVPLVDTPGKSHGLEVRLSFHGQPVSLLGIHAQHPTSAEKIAHLHRMHHGIGQWAQSEEDRGRPVVVAGDFNCTPWATLFKDFVQQSGLVDTSRGRIFEATRHVWLPDRILIDHVFVSPAWSLQHREVGPDFGSDHRPVFVTLRLDPSRPVAGKARELSAN